MVGGKKKAAIAPPGSRWRNYPELSPQNLIDGRWVPAIPRIEMARPMSMEDLRMSILAAGKRCKAARRKGWITETQERLESEEDDDPDEV